MYIYGKVLVSTFYPTKQNFLVENMDNRIFEKEDVCIINKYMKRCQHQEIQV